MAIIILFIIVIISYHTNLYIKLHHMYVRIEKNIVYIWVQYVGSFRHPWEIAVYQKSGLKNF